MRAGVGRDVAAGGVEGAPALLPRLPPELEDGRGALRVVVPRGGVEVGREVELGGRLVRVLPPVLCPALRGGVEVRPVDGRDPVEREPPEVVRLPPLERPEEPRLEPLEPREPPDCAPELPPLVPLRRCANASSGRLISTVSKRARVVRSRRWRMGRFRSLGTSPRGWGPTEPMANPVPSLLLASCSLGRGKPRTCPQGR